MDRGRKLLMLFLTAACFAAAGAGWLLVQPANQDVALKRLFLDVGLWVTLMALVAGVKLHPVARVQEIIEAMRALSRGRHDLRLEHEVFPAGLDEIARSYNELAATQGEFDDPNLGPVISQPRGSRPLSSAVQSTKPSAIYSGKKRHDSEPLAKAKSLKNAADEPVEKTPAKKKSKGEKAQKAAAKKAQKEKNVRSLSQQDFSLDSAEFGEVRVMSKSEIKHAKDTVSKGAKRPLHSTTATNKKPSNEQKAEEPKAKEAVKKKSKAAAKDKAVKDAKAKESVQAESLSVEKKNKKTAKNENKKAPELAETERRKANDEAATVIEPAREESAVPSSKAEKSEALPSRDELKTLFDTFVVKKVENEEDVQDLDFDIFAETLLGECERLIVEHECRAVRFEIALDSGEVSLQPRLMR